MFLSHDYAEVAAACSPPAFLDYRRETRAFESLSATTPWNANLTGAGEPEREPGPQIYVPYAQRRTTGLFLVVRTAGDPWSALPAVRFAVHDVDADLPLYDVTTMERLTEDDTRTRRAARTALAGFAAAAVALAALGLYGLLAQAVRERVPEIGVRMALGAQRADVVRLILADGGRLVLRGLVAGAAAALAGTQLLRGLLFGVTTADPATYAVVALLLGSSPWPRARCRPGARPAWTRCAPSGRTDRSATPAT